jgi:hypothetical protein
VKVAATSVMLYTSQQPLRPPRILRGLGFDAEGGSSLSGLRRRRRRGLRRLLRRHFSHPFSSKVTKEAVSYFSYYPITNYGWLQEKKPYGRMECRNLKTWQTCYFMLPSGLYS